ncbi:hypothetical protein ACFYXL_18345 [Streptomyces tsukubensis]|uniref:hypothetical protein n=1 Tax=Streptomyces tsukubensis TaxID=83656 RepID=UPI00368C302B
MTISRLAKFRQICTAQELHLEVCKECASSPYAMCKVVNKQLDRLKELIAEFTDEEHLAAFGNERKQ